MNEDDDDTIVHLIVMVGRAGRVNGAKMERREGREGRKEGGVRKRKAGGRTRGRNCMH